LDHSKQPASPDEQTTRAATLDDAAAKIAEEASATAKALESLERLLHHKLPLLDTIVPPSVAAAASEPAGPPPMQDYGVQAVPVAPPPLIALAPAVALAQWHEWPPRPPGTPLGGFLAGFALSWVFGAVLYIYLTMT
jgi:hypothetical protein